MSFDKNKIEELYPGALMYETMLINKGNETVLKKACESDEYFGQLKKDGYWYQYEKHSAGTYLFSRSASRTTGLQSEKSDNVPHIIDALSCLPNDTIIIGEIYYPGGSSKNVTTIMGCLPQKAIERQNGSYGKIHYYIHDILMYKGVNFVVAETGAWERYNILKKIYELHNLDQYDFIELADVWCDNLYERVGNALSAGEEGMVIKLKNGKYEPGKRPMTNLKAKKVDFADVIIIGFEEPTKEYYGKELDSWGFCIDDNNNRLQGSYKDLIAAGYNPTPVTKPYYYKWLNARIKIGAYDSKGNIIDIGTIHSGISDEMKEDMSINPNKYLNKVCSIQMMEMDKKEHTIRHGFFKFLREDKEAKECTIENIF